MLREDAKKEGMVGTCGLQTYETERVPFEHAAKFTTNNGLRWTLEEAFTLSALYLCP